MVSQKRTNVSLVCQENKKRRKVNKPEPEVVTENFPIAKDAPVKQNDAASIAQTLVSQSNQTGLRSRDTTLDNFHLSTESVEEVSEESTYSDHASPSEFACGVGEGWSQDDSSPLSELYILPERSTLSPEMKKKVILPNRTLSTEMMDKVDQKVMEIRPKYPIYVREITETSSKKRGPVVHVCSKFTKWLPWTRTSGTLHLQIENKQTLTKYRPPKGVSMAYICWGQFVKKNNLELKVGDVCLFEATEENRNRQKLRVHLIPL